MESFPMEDPCSKCRKSNGVFICGGCRQLFCQKHSEEHRRELAVQMDELVHEHDLLQRDFKQNNDLLSRIDAWEQESIKKIQLAAETARNELQELMLRHKEKLQKLMNETIHELQSSQELSAYTELDLKRWMEQLVQIRQLLEQPSTISVNTYDNEKSVIRLIKVHNQLTSQSFADVTVAPTENTINQKFILYDQERFDKVSGGGQILLNGLIANCSKYTEDPPCVFSGVNQYSSGVHYIDFLIRWRGDLPQFFGIITANEIINKDTPTAPSAFGWWNFECPVIGGQCPLYGESDKSFHTGDQLILKLDCNNRRIFMKNCGTNQQAVLEVNLQVCPFPWRMVNLLNWQSDCVQILYR